MTVLRLVLGDQLNAGHSWFRAVRGDVVYLLMETRSETDYVRHHAQKVLAIFAAMRTFAAALEKAGHQVRYLKLGDVANAQNFRDNLMRIAAETGAVRFERMEADEWRMEQALRTAEETLAARGIHSVVCDAEHFLVGRSEIAAEFRGRVPRMEYFYRGMRKRYGILLDGNEKPAGGKWNYDAENRDKWRGDPPAPAWPWSGHDLSSLWREIVEAGVQTIGTPHENALRWPLTRREARTGLARFVEQVLPHFGRFQDAMSRESALLFHSGLSFALNVKLLHPLEVITAALQAYEAGKVELASCEGFVRQILGWREFMRGVYWARMPGYARLNAMQADRPLPAWYWTGETGMACQRAAISASLDKAYAHHIQRLMVTGNFALLAGCDPDEVDAWYLGIYIDAFEWVEMPNTRGMSQFADGGVVASKPYAGAAGYVGRQSDYCKGCRYDPKLRHGTGACPLNSLYWHFLDRHSERFAGHPRLAVVYKSWAGMPNEEREATLAQAKAYLEKIDTL
ncbi:deoxyribodipyrimidine photolyase-related protein [Noviherbaspirillum humi]|uniref:Deoxyribodipyrimidine photolyase-related protein n=1 Tax=Noviherbaspirillum humi TaxID=1688639 RepID=A0A239DHB0_9BURK|nr:cryptochrome/photolyase family protein [Noviherbaspirillum humi]SNS31311.1 deoxyribodipyrimidine photolyase-related protein [Noviherbaspirillum humi]